MAGSALQKEDSMRVTHAKKKKKKIGTSQSEIPACRNKSTQVCCLGSFFPKPQL